MFSWMFLHLGAGLAHSMDTSSPTVDPKETNTNHQPDFLSISALTGDFNLEAVEETQGNHDFSNKVPDGVRSLSFFVCYNNPFHAMCPFNGEYTGGLIYNYCFCRNKTCCEVNQTCDWATASCVGVGGLKANGHECKEATQCQSGLCINRVCSVVWFDIRRIYVRFGP